MESLTPATQLASPRWPSLCYQGTLLPEESRSAQRHIFPNKLIGESDSFLIYLTVLVCLNVLYSACLCFFKHLFSMCDSNCSLSSAVQLTSEIKYKECWMSVLHFDFLKTVNKPTCALYFPTQADLSFQLSVCAHSPSLCLPSHEDKLLV